MRWLLLCFVVAGCNQIFGLERTLPADSTSGPPTVEFVQGNALADLGTTGSSASLAFMNPLGHGNAVVVAIYVEGALVTSVVDTLGAQYTRIVGPIADPTCPPGNLYIYAALDSPGGADTVTASFDLSSTGILLYVDELAHVASTDGGAGQSGDGSTDAMTSGLFPTHADNELIFGFGYAIESVNPGTDFVPFATGQGNITEGKAVMGAGMYEATGTSVMSLPWTMLGAAFVAR